MPDKEFDFWQDHSVNFLQMALSYTKREYVENPDGYGKKSGGCGDTVEIFLTVENNTLKNVSYEIQGCMNTNACAAALSVLVEGKTIDDAYRVKKKNIIEYLETLSKASEHCAEFAIGALQMALVDYQDKNMK